MNEPKRFRSKPVEIEAMEWDGGYDTADALWEWTARETTSIGGSRALATQYMVLGEDDAYEVFRCYDEDMELVPDNEVTRRLGEGYSAVVASVAD